MARPKSTELAERDDRVLEMAAHGISQRKIGSTLGISGARVNQIIREAREAIDPDAARARLGEILDELLEEAMSLAHGPGKRLVSASGRPVYELDPDRMSNRGVHEPDLAKPLYDEYAKLEAIKQINDITRNYANTFGLVVKPKEKDDSGALSEIMAYMQDLELQNRQMQDKLEVLERDQVVEGEIVP